jgi:nicotinate-nucleotide pyrophosphorylase (carboxylating)
VTDGGALRDLVGRALAEDVGAGDITAAAVVPADARARATISQKQAGVIFGFDAAREAFAQAGAGELDPGAEEAEWRDGVPAPVAAVTGSARSLLAGERVALNLLCHLSGVATLTARFVAAVAGSGAVILDTRKTTPGLRALEKSAVVAGGGQNHRMGLDDAVLIKENHASLAGGVAAAVRLARERLPGNEIEVECRDAAEVAEALLAGADRVLLDNMGPGDLRAAAQARDRADDSGSHRVALEASGGITLGNVAEIAASGVEFISVGALTHSSPALDLSMSLTPA